MEDRSSEFMTSRGVGSFGNVSKERCSIDENETMEQEDDMERNGSSRPDPESEPLSIVGMETSSSFFDEKEPGDIIHDPEETKSRLEMRKFASSSKGDEKGRSDWTDNAPEADPPSELPVEKHVGTVDATSCPMREEVKERCTGGSCTSSSSIPSIHRPGHGRNPTSLGILAARMSADTAKDHTSVRFLDGSVRMEDAHHRLRQSIIRVLDNVYLTTFVILLSAWTLFSDDIRLAATEKEADVVFEWMSIFTLVFFTLEIVLESFARAGYVLGVYFWLDLLAAASLLFYIPSLVDAVFMEDSIYNTNDVKTWKERGSEGFTLKFARIIRVSRLARILKLYQQRRRAKLMAGSDGTNVSASTRMGQKLSDLTTLRVFVGVLAMLMVMPAFEIGRGHFGSPILYIEGELQNMHEFQPTDCIAIPSCQARVADYIEKSKFTLWGKETYTCFSLILRDREALSNAQSLERAGKLRPAEMIVVHYRTSSAYFDRRWESQVKAVLDMGQSLFLVLVLGLGAFFFNQDANRLAVEPVRRMLARILDVADNPLRSSYKMGHVRHGKSKEYETHKLDIAISKICGLLAVGFGDAGAEIIAENMKYAGDLNPMVPGKKTIAVFGFCDIRKFTETTEILQEEIMEFVNTVAKIVHTGVNLQSGSANKNMGDGFLTVWKFPDYVTSDHISRLDDAPSHIVSCVQKTADKALAAFLKIIMDLRTNRELSRFIRSHGLERHLDGGGVNMGFGLHVGWAIEGAIGSQYKVDASYLSPNVNIASRLEGATKMFDVPLLFSEAFHRILPESIRCRARQVDRLTVKGSIIPLGVYTYDFDLQLLCRAEPTRILADTRDGTKESFGKVNAPNLFQNFLATFDNALSLYLKGDWMSARHELEKVQEIYSFLLGEGHRDGPADALLVVMAKFGFEPPSDWKGYRSLCTK